MLRAYHFPYEDLRSGCHRWELDPMAHRRNSSLHANQRQMLVRPKKS